MTLKRKKYFTQTITLRYEQYVCKKSYQCKDHFIQQARKSLKQIVCKRRIFKL